jgi:queuine/archaeosine tRNA-ribosyltransferase
MLSVHNSYMYLKVMSDIREHLAAGTFADFRTQFVGNYIPTRKVLAGRESVTV